MPERSNEPPFKSLTAEVDRLTAIRTLCIVARNIADELRIRGDHKIGASFESALRLAVDEVFDDA
jgi:hypothetical protein